MTIRQLYLALAIIGAVIPYYFFSQHFAVAGFGLGAFIESVFANPAAAGFTSDLLLSSFVFWIAMFRIRSAGKGPGPWLFIALNLLIGLSCALPAYLYAASGRSRADA